MVYIATYNINIQEAVPSDWIKAAATGGTGEPVGFFRYFTCFYQDSITPPAKRAGSSLDAYVQNPDFEP